MSNAHGTAKTAPHKVPPPGAIRLRSRREAAESGPELNNTSMTDIIFILLIFFISLSEVRSASIEIKTPEVSADPENAAKDEGFPSIIEITKDGLIYFDGDEVLMPVLMKRLGDKRAQDGKEPRIRVRGDTEGNYGKFVEVMFALSQAKFSAIEIAVQTKAPTP